MTSNPDRGGPSNFLNCLWIFSELGLHARRRQLADSDLAARRWVQAH